MPHARHASGAAERPDKTPAAMRSTIPLHSRLTLQAVLREVQHPWIEVSPRLGVRRGRGTTGAAALARQELGDCLLLVARHLAASMRDAWRCPAWPRLTAPDALLWLSYFGQSAAPSSKSRRLFAAELVVGASGGSNAVLRYSKPSRAPGGRDERFRTRDARRRPSKRTCAGGLK